jgi:hypothetical protein
MQGGFITRVACLALVSLLSSSMAISGAAEELGMTAQEPPTWTFMIYMAADVDSELPWAQDINELEAAVQADSTDIILLLDPPDQGDSRLLKIEHDDNYFDPTIISPELDDDGEVVPGGGEVNTASPATLRDFIVYSATNYPADNLVLVLWGHGAHWRGLCPDGYDILTLPELRSALSMAGEALGRDIDMVVLDICNGATLETAYEVREYADVLVGSELLVPSEGLPYMEIFNDLASDPSQTIEAFANVIVDRYVDWALYGSAYSTSMGAFDLDGIGEVVDGLGTLSALGLGYDRLYHELMSSALRSCEHSDDAWYLDAASIGMATCGRDLPVEMKHAALHLAQSHQSAVMRYEAITKSGTSDGGDAPGTHGLELYAPAGTTADEAYSELLIAETSWDEFSVALREARESLPSGPGPSLEVDDSIADGDLLPDVLTLTWNPSQSWNYTSYAAYVFQVWPQGLVLCSETHSMTPIVRVAGVVGDLVISASAFVGDEAHSHQVLNATLSKLIGIDITVRQAGDVPTRHLEVVTHHEGTESHSTPCLNGSSTVYLVVPEQGPIGGVIRVAVVDADDGTVLSERLVTITGSDIALTMSIHEPASSGMDALLTISIIASLALLGIALVIYANFLRRKD